MAGWIVLGIAAAVAGAAALIALLAAKDDADQCFSDKPVDSAVESCKDGHAPVLVADGADAITKSESYKDCPDAVKSQITSKAFTDAEKEQVNDVLDKMKPLMKCDKQPVKKIGRTDKAITKDGDCEAEKTTMGEWFDDSGTLVLTDAASDPVDFADKETQFKGTAAHELAHGLLNRFDPRDCTSYDSPSDNPLITEYRKATGWDAAGTTLTESETDKAPTKYAKTNSQEDLSESVMLYLYDTEALKEASPARYEFCQTLFGDK